MANIITGVTASGGDSFDSATRYAAIGDTEAVWRNTNETVTEIVCRSAGTAETLVAQVRTNPRTTTSTITLRVNSADSALSVAIGSGVTGTISDSGSVSIADGDTYNLSRTHGTGGGSMVTDYIHMEYAVTTGSKKQTASDGDSSTSLTSLRYIAPCGENNLFSSEVQAGSIANVATTISNMQIGIETNARSTTTVFTSRNNGVDGNQSISVGSGVTGKLEDTTNSDTVTAGNKYNVKMANGAGTGSIKINSCGMMHETDGDGYQFITGGGIWSDSDASGTPEYCRAFGECDDFTTESDVQFKMPVKTDATLFGVFVNSNSATSTTTARTRVNGANGGMSVAIGSGVTGVLRDTSGSEIYEIDDLVNYEAGGHNANIQFSNFSVFLTEFSAGGAAVNTTQYTFALM